MAKFEFTNLPPQDQPDPDPYVARPLADDMLPPVRGSEEELRLAAPEAPPIDLHAESTKVANKLYEIDRTLQELKNSYHMVNKDGRIQNEPSYLPGAMLITLGFLSLLVNLLDFQRLPYVLATACVFFFLGGHLLYRTHAYFMAVEQLRRTRQQIIDSIPPGMHINTDGEWRVWGKR